VEEKILARGLRVPVPPVPVHALSGFLVRGVEIEWGIRPDPFEPPTCADTDVHVIPNRMRRVGCRDGCGIRRPPAVHAAGPTRRG
jgi:hypothetical protein